MEMVGKHTGGYLVRRESNREKRGRCWGKENKCRIFSYLTTLSPFLFFFLPKKTLSIFLFYVSWDKTFWGEKWSELDGERERELVHSVKHGVWIYGMSELDACLFAVGLEDGVSAK